MSAADSKASTTIQGVSELLTLDEVKSILKISRGTIYVLFNDGALRPVKVGRSVRVTQAELSRYLASIGATDCAVA